MLENTLSKEKVRAINSLRNFNENELAEFLGFMEIIVCPQNTLLFNEAEPGDSMYLIVDGTLRVFTETPHGEVITKKMLSAGDAFGDIAFFHEMKRTASVSVATDRQLVMITHQSLDKLSAEQSKLAARFLLALANSLAQTYKSFN